MLALFDKSIENELIIKFDIVENIFLHNVYSFVSFSPLEQI